MNRAALSKFSRVLMRGAQSLLAGAVALLAIGALLAFSAFIALSTMAEGVHTPHVVSAFTIGAFKLLQHVFANFGSYFGWYLSFFGIFAAGCEIAATSRKVDYEQSLTLGFSTSLKPIWQTLGVGIGLAFVATFFVSSGNSRMASRMWIHEKGLKMIESEGWEVYLKESATFVVHHHFMMALYVFTTIILITVTIAAVRAAWSVGFWGVLRYLIALSSYLSRLFKVEGASAPIASILVTLIGMLITLL